MIFPNIFTVSDSVPMTIWLLTSTVVPAPIAAELFILFVFVVALYPINVLLNPVVNDVPVLCPTATF